MEKLATFLTKNLALAIPVAMVPGFIYGMYFDATTLKALILPITFCMVYPMMINLNFRKVLEGGDTKVQVMTQSLNFVVVPAVGFLLGLVFFPDQPYLRLGLLLTSLLPTSGMTISFTGMSKGNTQAAIKMTVIGLTLGSLAAPFYLEALLGTKVDISIVQTFTNIAIVVFLPMAAGYATQVLLIKKYGQEKFSKEIGPKLGPTSTLGVLAMVCVTMALQARNVMAHPVLLLQLIVPLLLFYAINYVISVSAGRALLKRGDAIAMLFGSVIRNLAISLAVTLNAFGPGASEAALLIALAFVVQTQTSAWSFKFVDRLFGPPPAPAPAAAKA